MFRVRKEHTRHVKTLHKNQLLPFMSLPVAARIGVELSVVNNTDSGCFSISNPVTLTRTRQLILTIRTTKQNIGHNVYVYIAVCTMC